MKRSLITSIIALALTPVVAEQAQPIVEIEFPDLGPSLLELATGKTQTPTLLYQLPDNFEKEKTYPVFVFLAGGSGGGQKSGGLDCARAITGGKDFIAVSLPLYRDTKELIKEAVFDDLLIGTDDYPAISKAYSAMFETFFEEVPQARKTGNIMGGFSNGAHTTSVLLSCQDKSTLDHFSHFIFADGGVWLSGLLREPMKKCRFLGLYGDTDKAWTRPVMIQQFKNMKAIADAQKIDFELIVMKGIGHSFPAQYNGQVRDWILKGLEE